MILDEKSRDILYDSIPDLGIRLEKGLELCPKCDVVADIGSDHGKLSVALLLTQKCNYVIASDLSAPSLSKTRKAAKKFNLDDKLELRIGNGFEPYFENEVDVAIIAGMGGDLISRIIHDGGNKAIGCKALLLQPMQHASKLRTFLRSNNWRIEDEAIINEKKRVFEWMKAVRGAPKNYPKGFDTPNHEINVFDEIGPVLFKRRDPLAIMRFEHRVQVWKREYEFSRKSSSEDSSKISFELRKRLSDADKLIKLFKSEGKV